MGHFTEFEWLLIQRGTERYGKVYWRITTEVNSTGRTKAFFPTEAVAKPSPSPQPDPEARE